MSFNAVYTIKFVHTLCFMFTRYFKARINVKKIIIKITNNAYIIERTVLIKALNASLVAQKTVYVLLYSETNKFFQQIIKFKR